MSEHRYYVEIDGKKKQVPSVTTILKVLDKPGLLAWSAREMSKALEEINKRDGRIDADEFEHLRQWGNLPHEHVREKKADAGTYAHAIVSAWAKKEPKPARLLDLSELELEKAEQRAADVIAWLDANGYTVLHSEVPLTNPTYQFGGTFDLVLAKGQRRLVGDLKFGKAIYDEVLPQLGGYSNLIGVNLGISCDGGLVLHAPMDGALSVHEVDGDVLGAAAGYFFALLMVYRMRKDVTLEKTRRL